MFGKQKSCDSNSVVYYYLTIPAGLTVKTAFFSWTFWANMWWWAYSPWYANATLDGATMYSYGFPSVPGGGANAYLMYIPDGIDITSMLTSGMQHVFSVGSSRMPPGESYIKIEQSHCCLVEAL
jgi:hypothetical protein